MMSRKEKSNKRHWTNILIISALIILSSVTSAGADVNTDLKKNSEELQQHLDKLLETRKNLFEVGSGIPDGNEQFFVVNSATDILSRIVVRISYEIKLFDLLMHVQEVHQKSDYEARLKSYMESRGIMYEGLKQLRDAKSYMKDDTVLYYFDEAEELVVKILDLFDQRTYTLKSQL
jgi:hypothetical protein